MGTLRRFGFVILLFGALSFACLGQQAAPQKQNAPTRNTPASGGPTDAFGPKTDNSNQELTHASNEAVGRTPDKTALGKNAENPEPADEDAAFKFSPAVQGIAHITGLSLVGAYWLCFSFNFAVVVVLIWLLLKANLPALFRGRTQDIQRGMEDARRSSDEAGKRLREVEARLARMSSEISEMQNHAELESKAEETRILASIEEEKKKILEAAQQEVGLASSVARRDLQKYAAELAIGIAEKGIRIDAAEDRSLVEDFAEQLGNHRNGNH
ncbi:MAG TPA: hypothetical protein VFQ00_08610 [Terriglobales bacterium]|nr:hypothetical protein [Terriglobales bacterium]